MITKTDITKLEEKFVTKEEFLRETKSIKTLIIEFKDAILHEIQGLREDVTIVTGYKDQIEDHETRIETIEKHLPIRQP
jgi:hypothetical protein